MKVIGKFFLVFNSISKKYKMYYAVYSIASVINSLIFVAIPLFYKNIIDKIISNVFPHSLIFTYVVLTLLGYALIRLWSLNNIRIREILRKSIYDKAFSDILSMDGKTFYSKGSGYWAGIFSSDLSKVSSLFSDFVYTIPAEIVMFVGILLIIFSYSKIVFSFVLLCALLFALIVYFREKYIVKYYNESRESLRAAREFLNSFLDGFEDLVRFDAGGFFERKYLSNLNFYKKAMRKYIVSHNLNMFATGFLLNAGGIIAVGLSLYLFTKSAYSFGTAVMINIFSDMVFEKMGYVVKNLVWLQNFENHIDKVNFLGDSTKAPEARGASGKFEKVILENVNFSFGKRRVLENCNMVVSKGDRVALLGRSGAGKSTLLKIIGGFLKPDEGIVRFEKGVPKTGVFFQGGRLFNRTVKENLLIAKRDATDEEITESLRKAGLREWLLSLPDGLDTDVGQGGKLVSGGERSRIALARLILFNPEIVLLDEPLAGVDKDKRQEIINKLSEFLESKTVLLITHEKDLLRLTPKKVFLEGGKLTWKD